MRLTASYISGLLFAIGLVVSGMTQADNVIGFLDVLGDWKAELTLVMGGAVLTLFAIKKLTASMPHPVFDTKFHTPKCTDLNLSLLAGGVFFGVGWGLSGLCPGPAIVSLATLKPTILLFVAAMTVGMTAHSKWQRHLQGARL